MSIIQSFVDARTPAIKDVGIDSIGAFIGILLVQAFCWSVLNNPNKRRKKKPLIIRKKYIFKRKDKGAAPH
ncbi:MAG: VanZ family protein [Blautia wexlerae]